MQLAQAAQPLATLSADTSVARLEALRDSRTIIICFLVFDFFEYRRGLVKKFLRSPGIFRSERRELLELDRGRHKMEYNYVSSLKTRQESCSHTQPAPPKYLLIATTELATCKGLFVLRFKYFRLINTFSISALSRPRHVLPTLSLLDIEPRNI